MNKDRVIGNNKAQLLMNGGEEQPQRTCYAELNDQLPVSKNTDIVVENIELSKGQLDPATGKLKWNLTWLPTK